MAAHRLWLARLAVQRLWLTRLGLHRLWLTRLAAHMLPSGIPRAWEQSKANARPKSCNPPIHTWVSVMA